MTVQIFQKTFSCLFSKYNKIIMNFCLKVADSGIYKRKQFHPQTFYFANRLLQFLRPLLFRIMQLLTTFTHKWGKGIKCKFCLKFLYNKEFISLARLFIKQLTLLYKLVWDTRTLLFYYFIVFMLSNLAAIFYCFAYVYIRTFTIF